MVLTCPTCSIIKPFLYLASRPLVKEQSPQKTPQIFKIWGVFKYRMTVYNYFSVIAIHSFGRFTCYIPENCKRKMPSSTYIGNRSIIFLTDYSQSFLLNFYIINTNGRLASIRLPRKNLVLIPRKKSTTSD